VRILYLPNEYSQQRQFQKKANIYPVLMAAEATYYRNEGHTVYWGDREFLKITPHTGGEYYIYPQEDSYQYMKFDKIITRPEGLPFLSLPRPDRVLTRADTYTSGNYKYLPGTHMQVANGCFWGKCRFCAEQGIKYEVRGLEDVLMEIQICQALGFREVFDDSGTFPIGGWLDDFCDGIKNIDIPISCNMRLVDLDYVRMREAGFRMLLFGVESANQETLNKINKGTTTEDIKYLIKASEAGLEPHIAVMFGFPNETEEDSVRTLKLVHYLLRKGYAKTAQASFYDTPEQSNESQRKYVKKIYDVWKYPDFWLNKIKEINNADDLKYLWRSIKKGVRNVS